MVKENAVPKFYKHRPVAFAECDQIAQEIDWLVKIGVLEKNDYSDWAAPIVTAAKPDGSIRNCGDFKITVNPYLEVSQHPLPNVNELFANLQL